jgi:PhzF family phenazine biosynthesis protein
MDLRIVQVDAFTDRPFGGNPAAVCVLPAAAEPGWMQAVAREMNLSETAFLVRRDVGYDLRWFTPTVEVDLCGHATLASAHVLWEDGHLPPEQPARFWTRSGLLTAERQGAWIELDFPAKPQSPADSPPGLAAALGAAPRYVGRNEFDYVVEVESEAVLRALTPDFGALRALPVRGISVTSRADMPGYDFVSRFFAPASGIDEDPVTGSAHCQLIPYWAKRLGKTRLAARQLSPRGGVLSCALEGGRVTIAGQARLYLEGTITL